MSEATTLSAEVRERAGKGAARATRRAGRVPAVIYGSKQPPLMISVDPLELKQQLRGPGFFARVFEVKVNGEAHRVLARDLQLDPVNDRPLHVDFMRFTATTKINVDVQMVFENEEECPGVRQGGVVNVVRRVVEMICLAGNIPESISVDLTGLEIGDSVHISDIELPEGVKPTIADRDFTIVTIAAPSLLKTLEEEEAEAAALEEMEAMEPLEGEEPTAEEAKPEGEAEGEAEAKE